MLFMDFSRACEQLEGTSGRLEMIDIIRRYLPDLAPDELPVFVRFVMGRIFPDWSSKKLGIGPNLLYEAIDSPQSAPQHARKYYAWTFDPTHPMYHSENSETIRGLIEKHGDVEIEWVDSEKTIVKSAQLKRAIDKTILANWDVEGGVSLYTYGPIADLVEKARNWKSSKTGEPSPIAVMPLGAGGPGSTMAVISPEGEEEVRLF